jgi:hypothetical protein
MICSLLLLKRRPPKFINARSAFLWLLRYGFGAYDDAKFSEFNKFLLIVRNGLLQELHVDGPDFNGRAARHDVLRQSEILLGSFLKELEPVLV